MRWLSAPFACALAGCSLIYNPNNLPRVDDATVDADPCALALSEITPQVIYEGQGTGGSAPAVLVIRGNNIVNANLAVELKAHDGTAAVQLMPVAGALASADHAYLAFTVTAPVDDKLGNIAATDVPLDVTVRQDAPATGGCMAAATQTLTGRLVLRVLPELTNPAVAGAVLYSRIVLGSFDQSGLGFPEPLALSAVSSITLENVSVSAAGATSGPGGYSAGATPGPGNGGDGANALVLGAGGGGGGAGFASEGKPGDANAATGGQKGAVSGEDQLVALAKNRASAGGKGGAGLGVLGALLPGGAGGGGGGTLVLTAGGDITTSDVFAAGGNGADGGGGGGGGAGAGGTVVVRSQSGKLKVGIVRVPPGTPGAPGGGLASVGRVRWDSPVSEAPSSPDRTPHRGPSFLEPMQVVTTRSQAFTLIGSPGDDIDIRVSDGRDMSNDVRGTSFSSAGKVTFTPQLFPGYNQLCAKLAQGATSESVANVCTEVAFVP